MERPRTHYAKAGDIHIAYQVFGTGPIDLLWAQVWATHIEFAWESPDYARFLTKISRFARVIFFDKRGVGMSDRDVGYTPLRIHGPSGRMPELGTAGLVKGMQQMLKWHLEAFDVFPIGDGYEIEVNEFDFRQEGGIVYDQDGVTVRSWPRSHAKDGAVGYRLDWNGLSFVWTGDGRPDELSPKYGEGVDVFVTEMSGQDIGQLMTYKYGIPQDLFNYTIDTHHTSHYAVDKLFADTRPR
ncbi:hypothetical protein [Ruegeria conchae]|uniref:hypothetical protein n=1 Tax=Ruegeria conchae TaxID=981384 RepID=UPI0002378B83|nr:hypothetical protein [Ruegeria conchae]